VTNAQIVVELEETKLGKEKKNRGHDVEEALTEKVCY
jgi:hypothetical protein